MESTYERENYKREEKMKKREKIHIKKVKGLCCAIGDCVKESKLYCQRCKHNMFKGRNK